MEEAVVTRRYTMSILNVEHLSHGFGDRAIFEDVSFRLLKGEHIGLVGANGEGKSTFMNIVTGKRQPDEGKVEWSKNVRAGYLDQHTVLEPGMTIQDVLRSAFSWLFDLEEQMNGICDRMGDVDEEEMNRLLEELGEYILTSGSHGITDRAMLSALILSPGGSRTCTLWKKS